MPDQQESRIQPFSTDENDTAYWIALGEKRAVEQWNREHPPEKPIEPLADWSSMQLIDILIDRGHLRERACSHQMNGTNVLVEHEYVVMEYRLRADFASDLTLFMSPVNQGPSIRGRINGDLVNV